MPHVAGVGTYTRTIEWDGDGKLLLHLPSTTDTAEVRVNGKSCGVCPWPPYVFDLASALHAGESALEVRVHNTLGNLILATYGGQEPSEYPTSGLLAPPRLLQV